MTNNTVTCEVLTQGQTWRPGTVLRRKHSQLFITYRIGNGEVRERWFARKRYRNVEGDLESIPRFKNVVCPGTETDRRLMGQREPYYAKCPKCGGDHELKTENELVPADRETGHRHGGREGYWVTRTWVLGTRSLKLEDARV